MTNSPSGVGSGQTAFLCPAFPYKFCGRKQFWKHDIIKSQSLKKLGTAFSQICRIICRLMMEVNDTLCNLSSTFLLCYLLFSAFHVHTTCMHTTCKIFVDLTLDCQRTRRLKNVQPSAFMSHLCDCLFSFVLSCRLKRKAHLSCDIRTVKNLL